MSNNVENKQVAESNEVMVINRNDIASVDMMNMLQNPGDTFMCSIKDDGTRASKVKIYNAINGAEASLTDYIGKPLEIVDVVAHPIRIADEVTGEIIDTVRVVLIDKNGVGYTAVSQGIVNSLARIFQIVGMPSWIDEPVKMEVKQVKTRNGNNKVNTLVLL